MFSRCPADTSSAREIQPCGYLDFNVLGYLASCAYFAAMRVTGLQHFLGMTLTGVLTKPLMTTAGVRAVPVETSLAAPAWQQVGAAS